MQMHIKHHQKQMKAVVDTQQIFKRKGSYTLKSPSKLAIMSPTLNVDDSRNQQSNSIGKGRVSLPINMLQMQ